MKCYFVPSRDTQVKLIATEQECRSIDGFPIPGGNERTHVLIIAVGSDLQKNAILGTEEEGVACYAFPCPAYLAIRKDDGRRRKFDWS